MKVFSFDLTDYQPIKENISYSKIAETYPDRYAIVINGHLENGEVCGNVVAVLSKEEYESLEKPENISSKFTIVEGNEIWLKGVSEGVGFFI